jgi:Domain of unknown function (DUF397)
VNDLMILFPFRKSSRCDGDAGCVEIAGTVDGVLVRDSKLGDSPILSFGSQSWAEFVAGVRDGQFD